MIQPISKPTPRIRERKPLKSRPHVIPWRVKRDVHLRDDGLCQWCLIEGGALDCHHRLPRSRGGRDIPEHLVSTHRLCHGQIHANPAEAYRRGFLVHSADELAQGWTA